MRVKKGLVLLLVVLLCLSACGEQKEVEEPPVEPEVPSITEEHTVDIKLEGSFIEEAEAMVSLLMKNYRQENCPLTWWIMGGYEEWSWKDPLQLDWTDRLSLDVREAVTYVYYRVGRFNSLAELKDYTEQIFTREYAETYLYPWGEEQGMFLERDGKLYINSYWRDMGKAAQWEIEMRALEPRVASLESMDDNTAVFTAEFYDTLAMEAYEKEIRMVKEDGLWKIASTHANDFLKQLQSKLSPTDQLWMDRFLYLYRNDPSYFWDGDLDRDEEDMLTLSVPNQQIANSEASHYFRVLDFNSLAELKAYTEQYVSKEYAENYLYPWAESWDLFEEQDGKLYQLDFVSQYGVQIPGNPVEVRCYEETTDTALLRVIFQKYDEQNASYCKLKKENGSWKLDFMDSCHYFRIHLPEQAKQNALCSDLLGKAELHLLRWTMGSGSSALRCDGEDRLEENYFRVLDFNSLDELKAETETLFTKEYAERALYAPAEEQEIFKEQDGKLYALQMTGYLGFGNRDSVELVNSTEDTMDFIVGQYFLNSGHYETEIQLRLVDGVWKLNSSPMDAFWEDTKVPLS